MISRRQRNGGLIHHHTHSLWFQWFFEVSKTVGGFAFTGLLGFIVVKKLKLQERRLSEVPWYDAIMLTFWLAAGPFVVLQSIYSVRERNYRNLAIDSLLAVAALFFILVRGSFVGSWLKRSGDSSRS